jgi:hypothetical protein
VGSYDNGPIAHLAAYSPEELFMERAHLSYDILEQMMTDLRSDTPDDLACLLAHSHAIVELLYHSARVALEEPRAIEELGVC